MKEDKKEEFKLYLAELFSYLKDKLKLKITPKLFLNSDQKNADKILGKTGYYDPNKKEIHLYITDRHIKDILRSFSHEIIHHWQNERGELEKGQKGESDPKYAKNDPHLKKMEKEAFLIGNMLFRWWEDDKKYSEEKQ